jgi:hypothetical protein
MATLSPKEGMTMDMQKKEMVALVTSLLKVDEKYSEIVRTFAARGVLKDNDQLSEAEKADKKELKAEIYQQKAKKAGGDQLKAAQVKDWKALTGHERDALQAAKNVTNNAVDAVWKRMRNAWRDIQKGDAEEEAGAPTDTVAKLLMERWKEFDIAATKGNKRSGEVPPDRLAIILNGAQIALEALVAEVKGGTIQTEQTEQTEQTA